MEINEKKKKKVCDSITYTTGDIQKNIDHFNKVLSGKAANTHLDGLPNVGLQKAAEEAAKNVGTFASQSPDGASSISTGEASGGEGCCESLTEQQIYISKTDAYAEIPDKIKILNRRDVENAVEKLEPEEEFEVGYVTPIYFYSELDSKFDLVKCTELIGYTGIDYIEARVDDDENKEKRLQIARDTAALGNDKGVHYNRQPYARRIGDFSAEYSQTNKTVKQHFDDDHAGWDEDNKFVAVDAEGRNYETILFYPKVGSTPKVTYYLDLHNGNGFRAVRRDQLERIILNRVAEIADELASGVKKDGTPRKRRWDDAKLAAKIRKQLESDAATISAVLFDKEDSLETRSKISNGHGIAKPPVRALYTNQIYFIKTPHETLGSKLTEELNLQEAKRYVRRYYIRPQNIFCSNKDEVLKALIELDDENCSVYTLNNLIDNDDVTKLTNKDIIYYYDDGKLYDKNKVKVMDYNLAIKHEEKRDAIDPDKVSDKTFNDVYDDRMTDMTVVEDLTESQSQEIGSTYDKLSKLYNIDLEELVYGEDGFMKSCYPNGFKDFAGDLIYSEKYWNEFEKWLKEVKNIELDHEDNNLIEELTSTFDTYGYRIQNVPEYAKKMKFIVARYCDDELWFYGAWNDENKARQAASELNNAQVIKNTNLENELDLDFEDINAFGESLKEDKAINGTCCICGQPIEGYGNNPEPYMSSENGRCCDACNMHFVIPARLDLIGKDEQE